MASSVLTISALLANCLQGSAGASPAFPDFLSTSFERFRSATDHTLPGSWLLLSLGHVVPIGIAVCHRQSGIFGRPFVAATVEIK